MEGRNGFLKQGNCTIQERMGHTILVDLHRVVETMEGKRVDRCMVYPVQGRGRSGESTMGIGNFGARIHETAHGIGCVEEEQRRHRNKRMVMIGRKPGHTSRSCCTQSSFECMRTLHIIGVDAGLGHKSSSRNTLGRQRQETMVDR